MIEPVEKDQGMYSIVITDPENSHKRSLELSGDGLSLIFHSFTHSLLSFTLCFANAVKNRSGNMATF